MSTNRRSASEVYGIGVNEQSRPAPERPPGPAWWIAAAVVLVVGVVASVWCLPPLLVRQSVDEGQLTANQLVTHYNAARQAVAVAAAALVAAVAAGAGVYVNRRNVWIAQRAVEEADRRHKIDLDQRRDEDREAARRHEIDLQQRRDEDVEARRQWQEEQYSQRFQDAAKQLGDPAAAVRLAGVYSMARLADDWPQRRQTCANVLCSYVRTTMPLENRGAELEVRQAVFAEVEARTQADSGERSWRLLQLNFAGAELEGVEMHDCHFSNLSLRGARVRNLVLYNVVFDADANLSELKVTGNLGLQSSGVGRLQLNDVHVSEGGSLKVLHNSAGGPPSYSSLSVSDLQIDAGARVDIGIPSVARHGSISGNRVRVHGTLALYAVDPDSGNKQALILDDVRLDDGGRIAVTRKAVDAQAVVVRFADDSAKSSIEPARVETRTTVWSPDHHVVKFDDTT